MVRRAVLALLVGAIAFAGAACSAISSGDGQRAQEILQAATAAQANVESLSFGLRVWGEAQGQSLQLKMDGGGYVKGERAGDFFMRGSMEMPGVPRTGFQLVVRNGRTFAEFAGLWQELPATQASSTQDAELEQRLAGFDITRYVTDVEVTNGTTFLGEPVTKIVGVIDTAALFDGFVGQLGDLSTLGGDSLTSEVSRHLGDTRAVLYVSDETHLLRAALVTIAFEDDQGQPVELHVDFAVRSVNEPVEIPTPPV